MQSEVPQERAIKLTAAPVPTPGVLGQFKPELVDIHLANFSSTNQTSLSHRVCHADAKGVLPTVPAVILRLLRQISCWALSSPYPRPQTGVP